MGASTTFMPKRVRRVFLLGVVGPCLIISVSAAYPGAQQGPLGLGSRPTPAEIATIDIAVAPDGEGLPPGRGTVGDGARVYSEKCADCHGVEGVDGPYDRLVGGQKPTKTIGSYWPYATTVFDYVRRTMPFDAPGSLNDEEIYAVTAWLLWKNDIIPADAVIDRTTLPKVTMPNRNAFIGDPRPDVP
jgi:mono/diheme cytochrome c family protein